MWKIKEHPGYLAKKRDELFAIWDKKYGKDKWALNWIYERNWLISQEKAYGVYAEAYEKFLEKNENILNWLCSFEEVYDTAPSNVHSGIDFSIQETPNNHIHDIAIRVAMKALDRKFLGTEKRLLQVRGKGTEGEILSPHLVPFHKPEIIFQGEIKDYGNKGKWWRNLGIENSVEEFYQQNKVLSVFEEK
jgi:hypothetical protein